MKPGKRKVLCIHRIYSEYHHKRVYDLMDSYCKSGKQLHIIAIDATPKKIQSGSRRPIPENPVHLKSMIMSILEMGR